MRDRRILYFRFSLLPVYVIGEVVQVFRLF